VLLVYQTVTVSCTRCWIRGKLKFCLYYYG